MEFKVLERFVPYAEKAAQVHPYVENDSPIRYTLLSSGAGRYSYDSEVAVAGWTVFTSRGPFNTVSYTNDRFNRKPVLQAFYADFLLQDVLPSKTSTIDAIKSGQFEKVTRRALVIVFEQSATLHFTDGESVDIPIPYRIQRAWPLNLGILVQRKREHGDNTDAPILYSLAHPLDNFRPMDVNTPTGSAAVVHYPTDAKSNPDENMNWDVLFVQSHRQQNPFIVTFDGSQNNHNIWIYNHKLDHLGDTSNPLDCLDPRSYVQTALKPAVTMRLVWSDTLQEGKRRIPHRAEVVFVTENHRGDPIIWFLSPQATDATDSPDKIRSTRRLTAMTIQTANDEQLIFDVFLDIPALSAVPLRATRPSHFDTLILHPDSSLTLWTGYTTTLKCTMPSDFQEADDTGLTGKRRRSGEIPGRTKADDSRDSPRRVDGRQSLRSPSRSSRVIDLKDPVDNRVNMVLSNGKTYRMMLDGEPTSELVARCVEALSYALPVPMFEEFYHRWLAFQGGPTLKWESLRSNDEWIDWLTVFLSFCHKTVEMNDGSIPSVLEPGQYKHLVWLNRYKADTPWQKKLAQKFLQPYPKPTASTMQISFTKSKVFFEHYHTGPNLILFLPSILIVLHLVYEDLKLNILYESAWRRLGQLLLQIACCLGWKDYSFHYQMDGIKQEGVVMIDVQNNLVHPLAPFSMASWILNTLRNVKTLTPLEYFSGLPSNGCRSPSELILSTLFHQISNLFCAMTSSKSSAAEGLVLEMLRQGLSKKDMSSLPLGVSLPILQALEECREDPPGNWTAEAYNFIGREDLAEQFDGTEAVLTEITKLRFMKDRRIEEVRRMLQSATPSSYKLDLDTSDDKDWTVEQQKHLQILAQRVLALPTGRALLTFGLVSPIPTEAFPIPDLVVAARLPPMNSVVHMEVAKGTPSLLDWPSFHNGVAAGLSVVPNWKHNNGAWIVFNTPAKEEEGKRSLDGKHAGFLLGLGLLGNLRKMNLYDLIDYMNLKHEFTAIALLLGLAATHKGDQDLRHTRLCYSHIEPSDDIPGTPSGLEVKPAAILSVGLLYLKSLARLHTEKMLYLLQTMESVEHNLPDIHKENCALACGLSLGLITLGRINSVEAAGIADIRLGERMLKYALGTSQPYIVASATIALGLMYLKTNDTSLAHRLNVPETTFVLKKVRPDILLLRILSRNLILWDQIEPSGEWISRQNPQFVVEGSEDLSTGDADMYLQASWNIVAGACFSIGLKYGGSNNMNAFKTLLVQLEKMITLSNAPATTFSQKLNRTIARSCLDVIVTSLSLVVAGSGNVKVLRILRKLHDRSGGDVSYGNHMATNMALGFLFLGGGTCTLGTSDIAVAALVCSLFPRYPLTPDDSRAHLQAFRHLWALAVEPRCLVTQNVETKELCCVPVNVNVFDTTVAGGIRETMMVTPCLLPSYSDIHSIRTDSPRYWPNTLMIASNPIHRDILIKERTMVMQRRIGHLSYMEDPKGSHSPENMSLLNASSPGISDTKSLLKAVETAPELCAFAQYVCPDPSPERSRFFSMVLNECIKLDRPELIRPYLWIDKLMRNLSEELNPTAMWNLKLILEFYEKAGSHAGGLLSKALARPLLPPAFLNQVKAELEMFFRELEASKGPTLGSGVSFEDVLHHLDAEGDAPVPDNVLSVAKAYRIYRDWPSVNDMDLIRQSLRMTKISGLREKALELAGSRQLDKVPQATLKRVLSFVHSS
ncbi:hypothetical protein SpCBS45565_g02063 [Spizellomyces sp. 'palustris']|nr:hypothetical protein SpCBS45565_g02063 [Spizellomyces sp. 'palustris']